LLVACLGLLVGCRTTHSDLQRWASREQGPSKLQAVMRHAKYPLELRVDAALTLVGMKPRRGQQIGLELMTQALSKLGSGERRSIVAAMIPRLTAEIVKPAPASVEQPDATIPFKDAAYALLTHEGEPLITSPAQRTLVEAALARWAATSFSRRLDDSSQKYGLVQVVHHLGAPGVSALPDLIAPGVGKVEQISALIAEQGDAMTKLVGAQRLVQLAREVDSERGLERVRAEGARTRTAAIKQDQVEQLQTQELVTLFSSMKTLGQPPAVEYLLGFARDRSKPEGRRAAALAALEGHVEQRKGPQLASFFALAQDPQTPAMVRDLALRRMADLPRKEVVGELYRLFKSDDWKTRWLAGELVLKMSDASNLAEFMDELKPVRDLAMTEALRYGALIGELKGPPEIARVVSKYTSRARPIAVRLAALGYYQGHGTRNDIQLLERHEHDTALLPDCKAEAKDCEWQCSIEKGDRLESKPVSTVGEFVSLCALPVLLGREALSPKAAPQAGNLQ